MKAPNIVFEVLTRVIRLETSPHHSGLTYEKYIHRQVMMILLNRNHLPGWLNHLTQVGCLDADPHAGWIGHGFECPLALALCSASAEFLCPVRLEKDQKMWMFEND